MVAEAYEPLSALPSVAFGPCDNSISTTNGKWSEATPASFVRGMSICFTDNAPLKNI